MPLPLPTNGHLVDNTDTNNGKLFADHVNVITDELNHIAKHVGERTTNLKNAIYGITAGIVEITYDPIADVYETPLFFTPVQDAIYIFKGTDLPDTQIVLDGHPVVNTAGIYLKGSVLNNGTLFVSFDGVKYVQHITSNAVNIQDTLDATHVFIGGDILHTHSMGTTLYPYNKTLPTPNLKGLHIGEISSNALIVCMTDKQQTFYIHLSPEYAYTIYGNNHIDITIPAILKEGILNIKGMNDQVHILAIISDSKATALRIGNADIVNTNVPLNHHISTGIRNITVSDGVALRRADSTIATYDTTLEKYTAIPNGSTFDIVEEVDTNTHIVWSEDAVKHNNTPYTFDNQSDKDAVASLLRGNVPPEYDTTEKVSLYMNAELPTVDQAHYKVTDPDIVTTTNSETKTILPRYTPNPNPKEVVPRRYLDEVYYRKGETVRTDEALYGVNGFITDVSTGICPTLRSINESVKTDDGVHTLTRTLATDTYPTEIVTMDNMSHVVNQRHPLVCGVPNMDSPTLHGDTLYSGNNTLGKCISTEGSFTGMFSHIDGYNILTVYNLFGEGPFVVSHTTPVVKAITLTNAVCYLDTAGDIYSVGNGTVSVGGTSIALSATPKRLSHLGSHYIDFDMTETSFAGIDHIGNVYAYGIFASYAYNDLANINTVFGSTYTYTKVTLHGTAGIGAIRTNGKYDYFGSSEDSGFNTTFGTGTRHDILTMPIRDISYAADGIIYTGMDGVLYGAGKNTNRRFNVDTVSINLGTVIFDTCDIVSSILTPTQTAILGVKRRITFYRGEVHVIPYVESIYSYTDSSIIYTDMFYETSQI